MKSISLFGLIALMCASTIASAQTVTTISPSFSGSGGISIHPDGFLLVADYGDALSNANGTQIRALELDPNNPEAEGMVSKIEEILAEDSERVH